ncbi:MAG TPA: hypothetical protein VG455_12400 [Acidimicrobiales bacterium]|nr:hypothetical protein [Acidimicrobiales bacterium]
MARLVRGSYEANLGNVGAFLPDRVPLDGLPLVFSPFASACAELAFRYAAESGGVRRWLAREFRRDDPRVTSAVARLTSGERETLMTALSVLGHTYRWDRVPPVAERFAEHRISLPPGIAGPWTALARSCDQPRVGTMWSLHLCNWKKEGTPGGASYRPAELSGDTLRVAHNWLLPPFDLHLERFSLSFVLLEAKGATVVEHLVEVVEAAAACDVDSGITSLERLHVSINAMTLAFSALVRPRTVDPAIWRDLVQPTFAWSAETDEPGRIEGGPSGMQLPTIQAIDAALGVRGSSGLAKLARAGRRYMPRPHRRFLRALDLTGPIVRDFVVQAGVEELTEQFNRCVRSLSSFRSTHQARGCTYLRDRAPTAAVRASTGLTIGIDDDAVATFEATMAERTAETDAASLASVGHLP